MLPPRHVLLSGHLLVEIKFAWGQLKTNRTDIGQAQFDAQCHVMVIMPLDRYPYNEISRVSNYRYKLTFIDKFISELITSTSKFTIS